VGNYDPRAMDEYNCLHKIMHKLEPLKLAHIWEHLIWRNALTSTNVQ